MQPYSLKHGKPQIHPFLNLVIIHSLQLFTLVSVKHIAHNTPVMKKSAQTGATEQPRKTQVESSKAETSQQDGLV